MYKSCHQLIFTFLRQKFAPITLASIKHIEYKIRRSQSEPGEVNILMDRNSVANTLTGVTNQLSSVTINLLGVAGLRVVRVVLGEWDIQDIRPLLESLCEVRICESSISCSVPAVMY